MEGKEGVGVGIQEGLGDRGPKPVPSRNTGKNLVLSGSPSTPRAPLPLLSSPFNYNEPITSNGEHNDKAKRREGEGDSERMTVVSIFINSYPWAAMFQSSEGAGKSNYP